MTANVGNQRGARWKTIAACAVAACALASAPAFAADKIIVGLITKTNANPFFAKMKEGAAEKAKELGVDFRSFAGKYDGDNTGQVDAIEQLMNAGAKAILITPSDTKAIVPTIERARKAGILVIALDTPLDPPNAADATFATDNQKAGELIGEWAAKTLGARRKTPASLMSTRSSNSPRSTGCATSASPRALASRIRTGSNMDTRPTSASSAINGAGARKRKGVPRWRRCCRRIRASISSTRSTSRPRPALMAR